MKDPDLYLAHIEECLAKIAAYTAEGRDAFMADSKTQEAVMRNYEIVGEAAKRLAPEFTCQHPHVPWRQIAGFRDILIHAYERVDLDEVWNITANRLPDLLAQIQAIRAGLKRPTPPKALGV